jgi:hypothetical protein
LKITVSSKERKLIETIRKIDYGEVRIIIQQCSPVRIEQITKSLKL